MKNYHDDLHEQIRSLFGKDEFKIEIKMVENEHGKINHDASVGIRVTHLPSGKVSICEDYESQIKNTNMALLKLKIIVDNNS